MVLLRRDDNKDGISPGLKYTIFIFITAQLLSVLEISNILASVMSLNSQIQPFFRVIMPLSMFDNGRKCLN